MTSESIFLCGPLLRYTYIDYDHAGQDLWHGTALVVLKGSNPPRIRLDVSFGQTELEQPVHATAKDATLLLADSEADHSFWRFSLVIPLTEQDNEVKYVIARDAGEGIKKGSFWVPAKDASMRILFFSCNGFSEDVQEGIYAGSLWDDVNRVHSERPFHVMVGGGDQVYSDGVSVTGPLKEWASLSVRKRAKQSMDSRMASELDKWYFENYRSWYSTPPFADSAASIPAVQIFDDHDIIDGFGSYKDRFMRSPYFLSIGKVAWKYYMLFQQHTPPKGEPNNENPTWVIGPEVGPYIEERSRSIFTTFGKRIAFFGLDCRVDRTMDQICHESTYDAMFDRLKREIVEGQTKHLLLLLGVPIAYPRLKWLENILSRYTDRPVRVLNKLVGVGEKYFNKFDGSAELLDDLNDHWCAGTHKEERNAFIIRLQDFAKEKQIRITILSGDVHLACVGRFFSAKVMPQNKDYRYMVNVISSAITNAPPPKFVANFLNRRNKLHRLKDHTQENLMRIFDIDPSGKPKKANRTMLASRNYCIITEHAGLMMPGGRMLTDTQDKEEEGDMSAATQMEGSTMNPSAAAPCDGTTRKYALDVSIRAEIDRTNDNGLTKAYGFAIPALDVVSVYEAGG